MIVAVPVPLDPMWGRPFDYQFDSDTAKLFSDTPAGLPVQDVLRYVIQLRP